MTPSPDSAPVEGERILGINGDGRSEWLDAGAGRFESPVVAFAEDDAILVGFAREDALALAIASPGGDLLRLVVLEDHPTLFRVVREDLDGDFQADWLMEGFTSTAMASILASS